MSATTDATPTVSHDVFNQFDQLGLIRLTVGHDHTGPRRRENTMQLRDRHVTFIDVVEHVGTQQDVEGTIGKGKGNGIARQ
jgi:hypothetical protein